MKQNYKSMKTEHNSSSKPRRVFANRLNACKVITTCKVKVLDKMLESRDEIKLHTLIIK